VLAARTGSSRRLCRLRRIASMRTADAGEFVKAELKIRTLP
jgi:hypothetical protein